MDLNKINRIAVLSDTHVPAHSRSLPPAIHDIFIGVDLIIHAGDHTNFDVITELQTIAPVVSVRGNMDLPDLNLQELQIIDINKNVRIAVCHGAGPHSTTMHRMYKKFSAINSDLIIFGHTHIPYSSTYAGISMFNPGSPTCGNPYNSVGMINIMEGVIKMNIIRI
jgi:putative phosphoesterase